MTSNGYITARMKVADIPVRMLDDYKDALRQVRSPRGNGLLGDKEMTPQELIDLPYAGNAAKQCKKAGMWDEDAGKPLIEYEVEYEVTERETSYMCARSINDLNSKLGEYGQTLINAKEVNT